ncbi:hypothetical protein [Winogradskyella undariae]|uniref:hypothetical protein n=1 Tax=Winogradskyella undariae TaxID=1285465 RepID=UPI0015CE3D29|nr:hypothetical protein [Winogradskyella undariae]
MRKIRTIKELLEIDIEFLDKNSVFNTDLISDSNDTRNFLLFDLKSKFLKIFDQFQISMFNKKAKHLQFRTSNYDAIELLKLIDLIVEEYGNDENDQRSSDWNTLKYMSWWFKNESHEPTYDDYENTDALYYGIMMSENQPNGIEFSIIEYSNTDMNFEKINWLQHRV